MRVAIIGGGPGGLMTAYSLQKRIPSLADVTIYEAGARLGGKIVTRRFDRAAVSYEAGAAELYDYSQLGQDPLRELVAELGLSTSPMWGETVVLEDHVLTTNEDIRRAFGERTLKTLKRFNRRARSLISPAEYYESDWREDNADPLSRRTFRALLASIPDEVARRYVAVAVHSDLATEPHQTNAMYGLQNWLMNERGYMRLYTIDGGIERLPQELAKRIKARVLLGHPVVRVEKTFEGRYRVFARRHGQRVSEDYDFVVVALPNGWLPSIEWGGPRLADALHRHHNHYDYPAHYLRVSVLFERPFWRERIAESYFMLDAFGGCCVYDESSRGDAGPYGVLGWLLGGEAALTLSNWDDDQLIRAVLDSLPSALRHGADLFLEGRVHRWVGAVSGLPAGFPARDLEVRHRPEPVEHRRLFLVGDYLFDSTINGVLDSAEFVVESVQEELEGRGPALIPVPDTAADAAARPRLADNAS